MYRYIFIFIISILLIGCGGAVTTVNTVNPNLDSLEYIKKQEHDKGYGKGYNKAKDEYIDKGYERAKKIFVDNYVQKIKAYEAGKYARVNDMLTESYIVGIENNNGVLELKSYGGEIKKELTPQQIIDFYEKTVDILPVYKKVHDKKEVFTSSSNKSNNQGVEIDTRVYDEEYRVEATKNLEDKYFKVFNKTYKNDQIFNRYGLNQICTQIPGNRVRCAFNNKKEYNAFCENSKICNKI